MPNLRARLAGLPAGAQWAVLAALSGAAAYVLELGELPAALLLGPMAGAILLCIGGGAVKLPRLPYVGAQAVIGCLIASAITPQIARDVARNWPILFGVVCAVIAASSVLGWLISRWQILPGSAGVWGAAPGGATAMVLMADAFGADARLVAFMQYLRVVCVATLASLMARFWLHTGGAPPAIALVWFPAIDLAGLATTLGFVIAGGAIGEWTKVPSGAMLVPMILGATLHAMGLIHFQLPEWLLAAGYAMIGWRIGLGFTPEVLRAAASAFLRILASILALIGFAFGLAYILVADAAHRSAHRLSCHQPRRHGFDCHHRGDQPRRHLLRDGAADGALLHGDSGRPGGGALRRPAHARRGALSYQR